MVTSFTDWKSGMYLEHHGVRGMRWGQRRWQNDDGSLTAAGRTHYGVSEGGNRRMERLYNRQAKKLSKLQSRADINTQRANIQKYNKRAKVAAGVGIGAAGVALGSQQLNNFLKQKAAAAYKAKFDQADQLIRNADNKVHELWRSDKQAYTNGKWNGKGYSKETWDAVDKVSKDMHEADSKLVSEARGIKERFNAGAQIRKAVTYAAGATAAVSAGVAAYNKIQAHMAKTRISDVGHQKAVQNVKKQVARMEKMFADTPYSNLVQKQTQKKKHNRK